MKYICDTNFILRYLLADNPAMFGKAKEIFEQAKTGQITLIIEQTVFTEVIFVLASFYQVPKEKIIQILAELIAYKGVKSEKEMLSLALDYYGKHHMHVVDCLLLAKAVLTNTPILSFDQKLNRLSKK